MYFCFNAMFLISYDENNKKGQKECPNISLFVGKNTEFPFTKLSYKPNSAMFQLFLDILFNYLLQCFHNTIKPLKVLEKIYPRLYMPFLSFLVSFVS